MLWNHHKTLLLAKVFLHTCCLLPVIQEAAYVCPMPRFPWHSSTKVPVFTPEYELCPCLFLGRTSSGLAWPQISYVVKDDFEPLNLIPPPLKSQQQRHATKLGYCGARNESQGFVMLGQDSSR